MRIHLLAPAIATAWLAPGCWASHAAEDGEVAADDAGIPEILPDGCRSDCTGRECGPDPVCGVPCGGCRDGWECTEGRTCRDRCGLPYCEQVLVPAGPFVMGSDGPDDFIYPPWVVGHWSVDPNEMPEHIVHLSPYWIDVYEVTNERYLACVAAGACAPPRYPEAHDPDRAHHPVAVYRQDAMAYCGWIGRRLPTEAEWEKAARGGCELGGNPDRCDDPEDERPWPWGWEIPDCTFANVAAGPPATWRDACAGDRPDTMPVGSFPAGRSPYGAYDMTGNVMEWVSDYYGYYDDFGCAVECTDPTGPPTSPRDVCTERGCAYNCQMASDGNYLWSRTSGRFTNTCSYDGEPVPAQQGDGFRCASDAD